MNRTVDNMDQTGGMQVFIGVLLLLIGIIMLLDRMGIIRGDFGDYLLPVALIALGASFIFKNRRKLF